MNNSNSVGYRVERNLQAYFALCAQGQPQSSVYRQPGVLAIHSGHDDAVFNAGFVELGSLRKLKTWRQNIGACHQQFAEKKAAYTLWLGSHQVSQPTWAVRASWMPLLGLAEADVLPGLHAKRLRAPQRDLPAHVTCEAVSTEGQRLDFCGIISACFALPFPLALQMYGTAEWEERAVRLLVSVRGEAAACVLGVPDGGVGGVYCLATLPAWRRQGLAEHLVRKVTFELENRFKCNEMVLESTTVGMKLYRRLGFACVTTFSLASPKAPFQFQPR